MPIPDDRLYAFAALRVNAGRVIRLLAALSTIESTIYVGMTPCYTPAVSRDDRQS